MEKITITRDGLPPIAFTGEEIGSGTNHSHQGPNQNRWTNVTIWRTQAGRFIAKVESRTCWQGERDHDSAKSFATADELIDWLKEAREDGTLGAVSQEAVEEAAKNDPAFAAAWVEVVE